MSKTKTDITTREEIELLMNTFYNKLLNDENINYIFTDVARINMQTHMPILADFWESILLNKNIYYNNTMKIHMDLNEKTPLTKLHFDTWLNHFNTTVDELFDGDIALLAKQRATSIATVMQIKIVQSKKP